MKNIYLYADEYFKLVKGNESEIPQIKVAAGRKNRKQLERDLAYAKDCYTKHKASLEAHQAASEDLSSVIDRESKEVERSRKDILSAYDVLRTMDLHDVHEVRFMNDDVGYVKNKRLFRLEDDNLVPFKRKKTEEEMESDLEADDGIDELLATLTD